MKIAVYLGGTSMERDVSLTSGKNIGEALASLGHDILYVDPAFPPEYITSSLDGNIDVDVEPPTLEEVRELHHEHIFRLLLDERIATCDFHFIGLHGGIGENGLLQGMFEHLGYHFNGPGFSASAVAMDKHLSKQVMIAQKIPTPTWTMIRQNRWKKESEKILAAIQSKYALPVVIKPNSQGSTIGLTVLQAFDELQQAIEKAFRYDDRILIEEYIAGREITAAILNGTPLPLVEIKPKHGIYDYECKYKKGMSEYEAPAQILDSLREKIQSHAFTLYQSIEAKGYSRIDFRLSGEGLPYCLEMNTLPGMTATSLVPMAARAYGMEFGELLEAIIEYGRES